MESLSYQPPRFRVRLLEPIETDGRESYLRGFIHEQNGVWYGHLTGHQSSGNLRSLVEANALLVIPFGVKSLPSDAEVNALPLWY